MKKIVIILTLLTSVFLISSKDRVSFWIDPYRDSLQKDGSYLYRIQVSMGSYPPYGVHQRDEVERHKDVRFRLNGTEYYYVDFNHDFRDVYLGRDRKEPYIWIKPGDKISIELVEGFPQAISFSLYIPEAVDELSIEPELVIGEKAEGSYVLNWSEVDCDQYSYVIMDYKSGHGNSIKDNFMEISDPKEWIEVEINSENSLEIESEWMILRASASGPTPQVISNFSWDDPVMWSEDPIVMYDGDFMGSGFSAEGPITIHEDDPSLDGGMFMGSGYTPGTP